MTKAPGNPLYLLVTPRAGRLALAAGRLGRHAPGVAPQAPRWHAPCMRHCRLSGRSLPRPEGAWPCGRRDGVGGCLGLAIDLSRVPADACVGLTPVELLVAESNGRYSNSCACKVAAFEAFRWSRCARVGRVVAADGALAAC